MFELSIFYKVSLILLYKNNKLVRPNDGDDGDCTTEIFCMNFSTQTLFCLKTSSYILFVYFSPIWILLQTAKNMNLTANGKERGKTHLTNPSFNHMGSIRESSIELLASNSKFPNSFSKSKFRSTIESVQGFQNFKISSSISSSSTCTIREFWDARSLNLEMLSDFEEERIFFESSLYACNETACLMK